MRVCSMDSLDLKGLTLDELRVFVEELGQPRFRAAQILDWLYNRRINHRVADLTKMANIPKAFIEKLLPLTKTSSLLLQKKNISSDKQSYYFTTEDFQGFPAELVGETLVLACQIGNGYLSRLDYELKPFVRDLTIGEMIDQIVKVQALTQASSAVNKISFSGMGEPLANYEAVAKAIQIINSRWGLRFYMRNILLTTCGLIPQIQNLANNHLPVNLSIRLHAVNDEIRTFLIPINEEYPLEDLLETIKYYGRKTGRTVDLQYTLIEGLNDSLGDARLMTKKLLGLPVVVQLISYSPAPGSNFIPSALERQEQFLQVLTAGNIKAYNKIASRAVRGAEYVMNK